MSDEINNFPHLKAGDRVKLTGEDWGAGLSGTIVEIAGRAEFEGTVDAAYFMHGVFELYIVHGGEGDDWSAELVEPKEDLRKELHDYLAAQHEPGTVYGDGTMPTSSYGSYPTREEEVEAVAVLLEEAKTDMSVRYEDPINPDYYKFPSGAEVKNISMYLTSCGGQALQYIARSTRLDGRNKGNQVENLRKAIEVINWEINRLEGK